MIVVENIHKKFGEKKVLRSVNMTIKTGRCNLIIGSSGSGKSVLLKCMVGLLQPDQGSVFFDGENIVGMSTKSIAKIRQKIGMLFQGSALFDSMTVEENVLFPLEMFSKLSKAEKKDQAHKVLERVNLLDAIHKLPAEISGGMKKRVGIARALVTNPTYLFCDEPNSGLDPQTSLVIDRLIKEVTEEYQTTTVVVTHDMNSLMEMGDNVIYLHEGKVEWTGDNKDVFYSDNQRLNDFIFASKFFQSAKKMRQIEDGFLQS